MSSHVIPCLPSKLKCYRLVFMQFLHMQFLHMLPRQCYSSCYSSSGNPGRGLETLSDSVDFAVLPLVLSYWVWSLWSPSFQNCYISRLLSCHSACHGERISSAKFEAVPYQPPEGQDLNLASHTSHEQLPGSPSE